MSNVLKNIEFNILSPEEIVRGSVVSITNSETIDPSSGIPIAGGLSDCRMNATKNVNCYTCEGNTTDCIGHFGHLNLSTPCYNLLFMSVIKQILECICFKCHKLRIDTDGYKTIIGKKNSLRKVWGVSKTKMSCSNCHETLKKVSLKKFQFYWAEDSQSILAKDIYNIFIKINQEVCDQLGLTFHPSHLIHTVFLIVPPCIRPTIIFGDDVREDDLTYRLKEIIKYNNKHKLENTRAYAELLQFSINAYYDIKSCSALNGYNQKALKSIKCRLKGKTGRMRNNIQGKRVDFSARNVITGDPTLKLQEVGIPIEIAMNLTFPETVTSFNIDKLQKYVYNGWTKTWKLKPDCEIADIPEEFIEYTNELCRSIFDDRMSIHNQLSAEFDHFICKIKDIDIKELNNRERKRMTLSILPRIYNIKHEPKYIGAFSIIKYNEEREYDEDKSRLILEYAKEYPILSIGDIVERHLVDGDWVVFNRQPTLHRMSMMGHTVRVMKGKTFRMNVMACSS